MAVVSADGQTRFPARKWPSPPIALAIRRAAAEVAGVVVPRTGTARCRIFVEEGYREWVDRLRDAEALLPQDSPQRNRLTRIREDVQGMRREWRERSLAPGFELYLERAVNPLQEVAAELQREIERKMGENEFLLVDEGDIPERYKKQVAEYFKQFIRIGRIGLRMLERLTVWLAGERAEDLVPSHFGF